MSFDFSTFSVKSSLVLKVAGVALVALVLLAIAVRLLFPMRPLPFLGGVGINERTVDSKAQDAFYDMGGGTAVGSPTGIPGLSIRNVMPEPPRGEGGSVGDTAEAFEATDYHATIETRNLADTCGVITALKVDTEIIFEFANESEHVCNYTFKVAQSRVASVLETLEGLDPKDLTENTRTIQRTVDDFTSEIEILEKKRATIESTLDSATRAYDQITVIAGAAQDASALAKIIDSKIQTLERLTQERLTVNAQLDRLARAKAAQLDRVTYTYFSVNIFENKYFDGEQLKDSWKLAVKQFVRDVNTIAQDVSVRLVILILLAVQYFVYILLLLLFVKLLWNVGRGIWKK